VAAATYGVAGEMTGLSYFGFNETRTFNSLLQMTQQTVSNGMSNVMDMQYNYTMGANNGRITSSVDGVIGETLNYGYDSLNRLSSAAAAGWSQQYGYDGFGNLTSKSAAGAYPAYGAQFDPATNHQLGVTYDANGNPDGGGGNVYDVENRMIAGPGNYSYDHAGKRVIKRQDATTYELYFYGLGGQKLETLTCVPDNYGGSTCTAAYNVYFAGKLVKSKGAVVATDRLGSVRASLWGATLEQFRYYPYGEDRTSTADGREKFGTYMRDNLGQDYADQRYYGVGTGRFGSADRSDSGTPTGPSTWNRYSYVQGDPVNFGDPQGLMARPVGCGADGTDYCISSSVVDPISRRSICASIDCPGLKAQPWMVWRFRRLCRLGAHDGLRIQAEWALDSLAAFRFTPGSILAGSINHCGGDL